MQKTIQSYLILTTQYIWLLFALIVVFWKGIVPGWQDKPADFNNYYTAAKLVTEKESIYQFYDYDWYKNQAKRIGIESGAKFSPFPPITAYVFVPLTLWDALTAKRIWLGINLFLLILLILQIRNITSSSYLQVLLFLSLFLFPITNCINYGQLYILITFLLVEVIGSLYTSQKIKMVGAIIGFLTMIKYVPILFLGYIAQHKKKYISLITFLAAISIPNLILYWLQPESFHTFFQHFQSHVQGNLPEQGQYAWSFQSIDSLLNNLFILHPVDNPSPWMDLPIVKPILKYSLYIGILGILFFTFKKEQYKLTPGFVSLGIIAFIVLLPATASYHLLLLLWPLLFILKEVSKNSQKSIMILLLIIAFITLNIQAHYIPQFKFSEAINTVLHYPRLWGLLCLFLLLNFYYCKHLSRKNYG